MLCMRSDGSTVYPVNVNGEVGAGRPAAYCCASRVGRLHRNPRKWIFEPQHPRFEDDISPYKCYMGWERWTLADRVSGHGFQYECKVGFSDEERLTPQSIVVDFDVRTDWRASAVEDRALQIVDYAEVDIALRGLLSGRSWRLIEAIAEAVAKTICTQFPVDQVRVTVTKKPSDMPHCAGVSVSCSRTPADYLEA